MIDPKLRQRLTGVFTALVTPFRDGAVDMPALEKLIAAQLAAGVAGLVPVGTTGEAATLSDDEAEDVIRTTVKAASGRAFVMAGAGSNATRLAIAKAERAQAAGADGILLVTPYYNKPSQDGLFDHFSAIASAVDLPIMLYSVP
ncbi:MAG: dihydrodipicolinate synthase family protein, partial [Bosea sp. (in: a-proteobacteria)]|nr:dihydrodipicolinate synthase family protein [Bosea sp. (in: a-proteobacteria)]